MAGLSLEEGQEASGNKRRRKSASSVAVSGGVSWRPPTRICDLGSADLDASCWIRVACRLSCPLFSLAKTGVCYSSFVHVQMRLASDFDENTPLAASIRKEATSEDQQEIHVGMLCSQACSSIAAAPAPAPAPAPDPSAAAPPPPPPPPPAAAAPLARAACDSTAYPQVLLGMIPVMKHTHLVRTPVELRGNRNGCLVPSQSYCVTGLGGELLGRRGSPVIRRVIRTNSPAHNLESREIVYSLCRRLGSRVASRSRWVNWE